MDTIEGNKLIAAFMGGSESGEGFNFPGTSLNAGWISSKFLEYETSWDWLMPVVEKIEDLSVNDEVYSAEIKNGECWIIWQKSGNSGIRYARERRNKIEATWEAVVAFIGWYNSVTTLRIND